MAPSERSWIWALLHKIRKFPFLKSGKIEFVEGIKFVSWKSVAFRFIPVGCHSWGLNMKFIAFCVEQKSEVVRFHLLGWFLMMNDYNHHHNILAFSTPALHLRSLNFCSFSSSWIFIANRNNHEFLNHQHHNKQNHHHFVRTSTSTSILKSFPFCSKNIQEKRNFYAISTWA